MKKSKTTKKAKESKKEDIDNFLERLGDKEMRVEALEAIVSRIHTLSEESCKTLVNRVIEMTRELNDPRELRDCAEQLGELLRESPASTRKSLINRLMEIIDEDLAKEQEGRPRMQAMWQLHDSIELLSESERAEFTDLVLKMSRDEIAPRHGRAVAEMLGILIRDGPESRREVLVDRLVELLDGYLRAYAMDGLGCAIDLIPEARREEVADLVIKTSEDWETRGTYPEKVARPLQAIYVEIPSRRDSVRKYLFGFLEWNEIRDMRACALLALTKIASSLSKENFDELVKRATKMSEDEHEDLRSAGEFALEELSAMSPKD